MHAFGLVALSEQGYRNSGMKQDEIEFNAAHLRSGRRQNAGAIFLPAPGRAHGNMHCNGHISLESGIHREGLQGSPPPLLTRCASA